MEVEVVHIRLTGSGMVRQAAAVPQSKSQGVQTPLLQEAVADMVAEAMVAQPPSLEQPLEDATVEQVSVVLEVRKQLEAQVEP
jgi:hypothetical protein